MSTISPGRLTLSALALTLAALGGCVDQDAPTAPPSALGPQASHGGVHIVTNTEDSGPGSLREAIDQAVDDDIIWFDPALAGATIFVQSPLVIDKSIAIEGPHPHHVRLSGGAKTRVFSVEGFVNANIQYLTIMLGNAHHDDVSTEGGGIRISGEALLNLAHSHVGNNSATEGAGIWVGPSSHLNAHNTTIAGNHATIAGGGIAAGGSGASVRLFNSTISRNTSSGSGGGIWTGDNFVGLNLTYSTVAFNNAATSGGGIHFAGARVQMRYSIVSSNTVAGTTTGSSVNCSDFYGILIEADTNLSNDTSCGAFVTLVADPQLESLSFNGGPTQTHALPYGSPALDVIPADNDLDSLCTTAIILTDQRGVTRPQRSRCDLGAFERKPVALEVFDELISLSAATPGVSTGTHSKLLDARDKLLNGQIGPACSKLKAYIKDVTDQRGKKIATSDADALIALATELRALLGC